MNDPIFDPHVPGIPGNGAPVVLQTDEARGLTYTWFDISREERDWTSRERGYLVSRLSVTDVTGQEVGYLKITHTTPEMVAAELPTAFHWADENTGTSFGFRFREPTPEKIWAAAYQELGTRPASASTISGWSLSASDAPSDPQVLTEELAAAEAVLAGRVEKFVAWLSVPYVDYANLNETAQAPDGQRVPLRGTGVAQVMYRLAAQRLGTQGKVLRASSLQSPSAQALWARLVADPQVPTRQVEVNYWGQGGQTASYVCIDYATGDAVA